MSFWQEHVDKKALMFAARVQPASALSDIGMGPLREAAPGPTHRGRPRETGPIESEGEGEEQRGRKRRKRQKKQPGGKGTEAEAQPKGAGRGRGKGNAGTPKTGDGRFFRDEQGTQLCWVWNRSVSGCSEPCPAGRAHKCEWCRGPHRTVQCRIPS